MTLEISPASTPGEIAHAKALFLEYAEGLGFSLCFQGFDREVAELPGAYAPPRGRLFLAHEVGADGERRLAGCIALRPLPDGACEMKRLYVRDAFRGRGLGRLLAEQVLAEAREMGYARMRLDTLPTMTAAIPLYRSLGFREIEPYYPNPVEGALFMEKELSG